MTDKEIKALVARLVDEWLGKIPISFEGEPLGRNLYRMIIELMDAKDNNSHDDLIELARKGNGQAEGALCIEASKRIAAGERLEEPLAGYVMGLLMRSVFNHKRTKADKNLGRDLLSIKVLWELDKQGVLPTANRSKKKTTKSGCSYLADDLKGRGLLDKRSTARTLEEVWGKRYDIWHAKI
jgi:hypothetical protein